MKAYRNHNVIAIDLLRPGTIIYAVYYLKTGKGLWIITRDLSWINAYLVEHLDTYTEVKIIGDLKWG